MSNKPTTKTMAKGQKYHQYGVTIGNKLACGKSIITSSERKTDMLVRLHNKQCKICSQLVHVYPNQTIHLATIKKAGMKNQSDHHKMLDNK